MGASRVVRSPVLLVLLVAPFFGEGLSGSSPPFELLLPWNLAFMAALYGCGALVCREVAHRFGLGFTGLVLLAIAYAVWEEALVDRYWFFPQFWADSGVGTYSVVWHTNVLLATHLTVFHTALSICASVLVVEWFLPQARARTWVGRPGLVLAGLVLAATPVIYGEFDQRPPIPVLVAAGALLIAVVVTAFLVGRRRRSASATFSRRRPDTAMLGDDVPRPRRGLGVLAFACLAAHWILTYAVAETGLVWPLGVALSLLPVAIGLVLVPRLAVTGPYGSDGRRVVAGLLAFFVLLDLLIALVGQYDMVLSAIAAAWLAWWLYTRRAATGLEAADRPPPHPVG
ncbi:hypothetical protein [Paractinoplanes lichenicola]|uniref:Uncharacterized protein n=1 Tax=Paractinoplanes lichenicola TaxID=2802976 RepID=A0ABS1VGS3_9ACTN|nr:hypothetical protein [Actinoplanes lichenicola]MBL7252957.1 hypothetical protein [Actinoplanes lichenicola]